ncbi:glycosyltransferase [Salinibacter ruber]|uniref:glycosyltransferase n=1 Tax=Salinibacter ruber TaxID=146919 RepID=UPI00207464AE|nr:glycosyltransferase [Salinibacter ruber]
MNSRFSLNGFRICLITTGQPATNPRLVKEADALVDAGADVHIVACKFQEWAEDADHVFENRVWKIHWLRYGMQAPRWKDLWQRLRRKGARLLVKGIGPQSGVTERAIHYVTPELTRSATRIPADLYVGHNLPAVPAAAHAAEYHDAHLGFDAEDFHRGEFADTPENALTRRITSDLEERYIPRCDYVTAASDGIGAAYADVLDIEQPTTILNVFRWSERENSVPENELEREVPEGKRSLYWFSQTIGPDRGLEDALRALPTLPDDVLLSLRGKWSPRYENTLREQANRLGVADRVRHLELVPPDELIPRTAQHDVGLALEQPSVSKNRTICLTNKLFTYLLAGVPFIATDTPGQRPVVEDLSEVARLYSPGEVDAFADQVTSLLAASGLKEKALRMARECYCWEVEQKKFLRVIQDVL